MQIPHAQLRVVETVVIFNNKKWRIQTIF